MKERKFQVAIIVTIICFLILTILVLAVLRLVKLHAWIGVGAVCVWCFFDEWTKRSIPGRVLRWHITGLYDFWQSVTG